MHFHLKLGNDPECWVDTLDQNSTSVFRDRLKLIRPSLFIHQTLTDRKLALKKLIELSMPQSKVGETFINLAQSLIENTAGTSDTPNNLAYDAVIGIELDEGQTITNPELDLPKIISKKLLDLNKAANEGQQDYFNRTLAENLDRSHTVEILDPHFHHGLSRRNGGWVFRQMLQSSLRTIRIYLRIEQNRSTDRATVEVSNAQILKLVEEHGYDGKVIVSYSKAEGWEFHDRWIRLIHERGSTYLSYKNSFDSFDRNEVPSSPSSLKIESREEFNSYLNWVRLFDMLCESEISNSRGIVSNLT